MSSQIEKFAVTGLTSRREDGENLGDLEDTRSTQSSTSRERYECLAESVLPFVFYARLTKIT